MAEGKSTGRASASSSKAGDKTRSDRLFIDVVARGFRVLESFSETTRPMSLTEIARAADCDKSAAQRLTHTLLTLGYLERTTGGVVPGRRILERAFDYLGTTPLVRRAIPVLADLRSSTNERVDLSLFDDTSMMYLVRMQSKRVSFYAHLVGARVPTFCTSGGRAVLSHLPEDQILDIIHRSERRKLTLRTTIEIPEILERIAEVRETGYSLAVEEVLVGEVAVGTAVLNTSGYPIAAIHIVGSLGEWTPREFVERVGPLGSAAANALRGP